jgi:hypothetical protein
MKRFTGGVVLINVIILILVFLAFLILGMLKKKTAEAKNLGNALSFEKKRRIGAELKVSLLREEINDRMSSYTPNQFGNEELETLRILLNNGAYSRRLEGAAGAMLKKVSALLKKM